MDIKSPTHPIVLRMQRELDQLRLQRQRRQLDEVRGINLSSNDYLGLSDDPRLKLAIMRSFDEDARVCSTGSRLLSGNSPVWEELEDRLAEFMETDASLYFSSGYLANIGVLTTL